MSSCQTVRELALSDNSCVHQGDKRRVKATTTASDDSAAEPTQIKITFTPPSGSTNATTYAKTAGAGESSLTQESSGIWYADHTFDEGGWWTVVAAGSGNMGEVDPTRIYVTPVTGAPS